MREFYGSGLTVSSFIEFFNLHTANLKRGEFGFLQGHKYLKGDQHVKTGIEDEIV